MGSVLQKLAALRSWAVLMAVVALAVALLEGAGLVHAVDDAIRRVYPQVSVARESTPRVMLVAMDAETKAAWGVPPWDAEQAAELMRTLSEAQPALVAVISPELAFGSGAEVVRAEANASPTATVLQPDFVRAGGVFDRIPTDAQGGTGVLLAAAGHDTTLGPLRFELAEAVPTVSATRVVRGEIPPSSLRGAVIVVGTTLPELARVVPTTRGEVSAAELMVQAASAVADGRALWRPFRLWALTASVLLALAIVLAMQRVPRRWLLVGLGTTALTVVAADYVLLRILFVDVGAGAPLSAVVVASTGHWYAELRRTTEALARTRSALSESLRPAKEDAATEGVEEEAKERAWWQNMAIRSHELVGRGAMGIVAELPDGAWHVQERAYVGVEPSQFVERRRDVRRDPYRAAFLTHLPAMAKRQVLDSEGYNTLVVPLAKGRTLFGVWLLHIPVETEVSQDDIDEIGRIGLDMGRSIHSHRLRAMASEPDALPTAEDHLRVIEQGISVHREDLEKAALIVEHLPVGLMVADPLGEVIVTNAHMRRILEHGVGGGVAAEDARAVVARLMQCELDDATAVLQRVVERGEVVNLDVEGDTAAGLQGPTLRIVGIARDAKTKRPRFVVIMENDRDVASNRIIGQA